MRKKGKCGKMVGDKEEWEGDVGSRAWKAGNEVGLSGWPPSTQSKGTEVGIAYLGSCRFRSQGS